MRPAGSSDEYAPIAELYDHVVLHNQRPDIEFYVDAARKSGGPVLELGCGSGRVLIPTARAGVEITGLDVSAGMLDVCRESLGRETEAIQTRATLVTGSMTDFDLPQRFRLVTIPFRPFQHLLTVDDQFACLRSIHRHLTADGRLIVDLFNPSLDALANLTVGEETGDEPEFTTPDGRRVMRRHRCVEQDR